MTRSARVVVLLAIPIAIALRIARHFASPTELGPPHPAPPCAVAVEFEGEGVRCFDDHSQYRSGDRVARNGALGRMAPDRIAALRIAVDANHASAAELASLPDIGPRMAERIIAGRPYRSIDDLARVSGIGARRLAKLRPRLHVF